jgi:hypothetical protein
MRDNHPKKHGTRCITTSDEITLQWDQLKYIKTIPLDPSGNNVADMWTQPGYIVAEVFVDTFSRFTYVHLQQTTNTTEALEAKKRFESCARTDGVTVKHYHADNGRFIEKTTLSTNEPILILCRGGRPSSENGIVEKRIRDLQDLTRSSLIHAIRRWPDAVNTSLWPYALRKATKSYNNSTPPGETRTIAEIFSGTKVAPNLGHEHPFGCPVC